MKKPKKINTKKNKGDNLKDQIMGTAEPSKWYCYILGSKNPKFKNSTYVGMSNDVHKRLR